MDDLRNIPLSDLIETTIPLRPVRVNEVEFHELLDSVRKEGVLQPLLVRPRGDKYEVVDGMYRFTAARAAGLTSVACKVGDYTDEDVLRIQLQANALRPVTTRLEFAERLNWLISEKGYSLPELARLVNKSVKWISEVLEMNSLHPDVKKMVVRGELPIKAAVALATLPSKLQAEQAPLIHTLNTVEFVESCRVALKEFREWIRTGKTETTELRRYEPHAHLRQLRELRDEARDFIAARAVLVETDAKTPLDGWRSCLAWVLHLDPQSVRTQLEKQERAKNEKLSAADRRKRDRELRLQLSKNQDFKNEQ